MGERLAAHLVAWLGAWPPIEPLRIVVSPKRDQPSWDGSSWLGLGVESPHGTVLSLSPRLGVALDAVDRQQVTMALRESDPSTALAMAFGRRTLGFSRSVFRWTDHPAPLPDVGEWVAPHDPRLPAWLDAFNDDVLVARDAEGGVAAGVGRKIHNRFGQELAVGTDPAHRGRGLARALVAQAARRVLAEGAVPLYLHHPANIGSASVADAAGFPDRSWHVIGIR
ncbi:MAG: GNAT family N-acetyltransferase [Chloroflexia bacterium]|nr:GNAT family N-acetyltransferase [Chloroflexia bacterium]